jgi:hypothetical protein
VAVRRDAATLILEVGPVHITPDFPGFHSLGRRFGSLAQ